MEHNITVVGLDAHKNSIELVTAETAGNQEVRHYGKIGGDMTSLDKAIRKLRSARNNGAAPWNRTGSAPPSVSPISSATA